MWASSRVESATSAPTAAVVDRLLEPLGLVLKAGTWYLVATASDDDRGPRTYRVSRVHAAAVLDETFARPAGFDLRAHWADYQRDYAERAYRDSRDGAASRRPGAAAFPARSGRCRAQARAAMAEPDADGWARTTVPIESVAPRAPRAAAAGRRGRGASSRRSCAS